MSFRLAYLLVTMTHSKGQMSRSCTIWLQKCCNCGTFAVHCISASRLSFVFVTWSVFQLAKSGVYLISKLINIKPSGRTRSSEYLCLSLPLLTSKLKSSNRFFHIFAPHLWNSLPPNLRTYAPVSDESITNITNISRSSVSSTFKPSFLSQNRFLSRLKRSHALLPFLPLIIPFSAVVLFPISTRPF